MKRETQEKKFRLPKEFAEKWIAALRSGEYKQSNFCLCKEDGYCCLGVAGKVCGIPDEKMNVGFYDETNSPVPENFGYPRELVSHNLTHGLVDELMRMNDTEKKSFLEIADWIEQNVKLY